MTPLSNEDFADRVISLACPEPIFAPTATYDPDGDCVEFLTKPDPFFAERVDDLVTVYYSQETNEVVGSLLKGVSRFCDKMLSKFPGFRIDIIDGRVKLEHIFRAQLWTSTHDPKDLWVVTYRKLMRAAEDSNLEAELCHA
jgi:hypothetical protein